MVVLHVSVRKCGANTITPWGSGGRARPAGFKFLASVCNASYKDGEIVAGSISAADEN
jgi:hypothetical protein